MKSLEENYLSNLKFPPDMIASLRSIGEYKGKEELYTKQSPDVLEKLLESAIIQSAESSSRIEGITAPPERIEVIVKAKAEPRNRPEQEIAGYRDVLNYIHQSYAEIPLTENTILQFHSMLFRFTTTKPSFWKINNNKIIDRNPDGTEVTRFVPVSAKDTPGYMNKLINLYNDYQGKGSFDPIVLVPLFVFDFLCIHPFSDGNGRISRLLTLLFLYLCGYKVGKYISLERIIEESKSTYYDVLLLSSKGWHEGKHNVFPWLNYFYGVLIAAYKEFESRIGVFKGKGHKTEQVKSVIQRSIKPFSIVDIEEACPNVTRDTIRKVLRELRDEGVIKPTSMGRGAKWVKK
ncbi:cell filamentation protein Fic [Candidatus Desantisbacteria bacterium CG1_02_38_46]|uniref:Cell filamentation protein Fic n=1 Tax=Candidatus Desantisbacteria bacterium CG1_02_38_46 TaxID=1817893 RepID=A0A1J4SFS4_9BACT|nr:MAG: cell filamentation protein Fic [Candidatus Desantisbacteria bacterium CG1_02_38_46]